MDKSDDSIGILKPHIPGGEPIEHTYYRTNEDETWEQVVAITDRRLLIRELEKVEDREIETVDTVALKNVSGITVRRVGDEPISWVQLILGVFFALIGVATVWAGVASNGTLPGVTIATVGVILMLTDTYVIYDAVDTEDGHISVSINAPGSGRSLRFPLGEYEFVSNLNKKTGDAVGVD